MNKYPPFATDEDFIRGKEILIKILENNNIKEDDEEFIDKNVIKLMGIIYGKGAGYSRDMFYAFGETYVKNIMYR